MSLGQQIRKKRREKGMSMERLGRSIGSGKTYIHHLESGIIKDPGIIRIAKIAFQLGVTIDSLVFGSEE